MAAFCLGMAGYAIQSGTLIMRGRYDKEHSPIWFWFGTISYTVLGIVNLILFLSLKLKNRG